MAATSGDSGGGPTAPATPASNYPPIIAMTVIAVTLVVMVQFQSTERLAAAFAWLIFVAVALANGQQALTNLGNIGNVAFSSTKAINTVVGKQ